MHKIGQHMLFVKYIKLFFTGDLIVRSCYNDTYDNHTILFSPYTRDECLSQSQGALTVCHCEGDLCNTATTHEAGVLAILMFAVAMFIFVNERFIR